MPEPVTIHALTLVRFRNHRLTRLAPGQAPLVVLTGANGAGKTNVLEALSLLAPGRGLRGAAIADMAMSGSEAGFAVQAEVGNDSGLPAVAIKAHAEPHAPERRRLMVNGAPAPVSSLSQWLSVLWLTPAMDRLFAETPGQRRRFLDRLVLALFPDHGRHASRYEAAMRARTRLLTDNRMSDPIWLAGLEQQMAEHGSALADARRRMVAALSEQLKGAAPSAFPRAGIALACDEVGVDWSDVLRRTRDADAAAGRATRAPHRVDLAVTHADKAMPAAQASTGEQKALLVAIVLAHAALAAERTGRLPLLLLDEAAAHLDASRRTALFDHLLALGGQTWLTGTDRALFPDLATGFALLDGSLAQG